MTSIEHSSMTITNNVWTLSQLLERVKFIKKPKFNRDLVWDIIPTKNSKKKTKANFKEYILFLIKTNNSVYPLSLGSHIIISQEFWYVIDGNNRINATITFLVCPYKIFSEYYNLLFEYIDSINSEKIAKEHKQQIKNTIEKLTYKELSTFNRIDDNMLHVDLIDLLDFKNIKEIEKRLIEVQKKLRSKDGTPFDTSIKLLINEFKHGTNAEYCKTFEAINIYANSLSPNELLAATLFEVIVVINNYQLKCEIIKKVVDYYENRGKTEVLEKFNMDLDFNQELSAYDFMVGFQNLCSEKYKIIGKFTHSGTSLFFKIYNNLYGSIEKTDFIEDKVNDFINKVTFACGIIEEAYKLIMPENINNNYYSPQLNGINSELIADNAMVTLFISNIANKDKLLRDDIINKNRCILIYHLLCNKKYLKNINDEKLKVFMSYDKLIYQAGGNYTDNICLKILNGEVNMYTITREQMSNLLEEVLTCSFNNKKDNKSSSKKRRQLNMFDKILISTFWFVNMSNYYIKKNIFETEHITPFSSTCNGEIDIDRIGNLFPTLEEINGKRGNKNLEIYYKKENIGFTNLISVLLPSNYDDLNIRDGKKNNIISIEKYNEYCKKNEELYIKTLLDNLFPNHTSKNYK